ncbi:UNVERIFIED_CONTAM: Lgmn [Trichonephila clavipes]
MTDDIANNGENLRTGIVLNHTNGNDVYKGVSKDYTGEDVTPKTFIAVLKGDEKTLAGVGSESSYACYFDHKRDTYLEDSYSVHWMEDSDQELHKLQKLFKSLSLCLKWRRTLFAAAMCTLK